MNKNLTLMSLIILFLFVGCAKEGPEGKNSLVDLIVEPASTNCPTGGYKIISGIDQNNNSSLDASEIQNSKYICNGRNGNNSMASLVPELPGSNCATGGYKLNTGVDANNNNVLDASEIANSQLICNGMTGSNSLVSLVAEPASANCPNGGYKVIVGTDQNGNNILDASEMQTNKYICNGTNGSHSLTSVVAEPAGPNCASGGYKLHTGTDKNNNGILETAEITNTQMICNGSAGTNSLVSLVTEPAGANCQNGGNRVNSGLDNNNNGKLDASEIQSFAFICNGGVNLQYLISVKPESAGGNCNTGGYSFNTGFDSNRNGILDISEIAETTYICNTSTQVPALKNVVYVGTTAGFYALNATNGSELWRYSTTKGFINSGPLVYNGKVYAGSTDSYMYALDARTGEVEWSFSTNLSGIRSDPTIANGILYFGSMDHNLYALDANTGKQIWKFETSWVVETKPVVLNGTVYFGSRDTYVYALNATTGSLIWKYKTGDEIGQSDPVVHNGALFIGNKDSHVYAINVSNGSLKWKHNTGISMEDSNPAVHNGNVYIGVWSNAMYGIDESTGVRSWTITDYGTNAKPCFSNNGIFFSASSDFYALNVATKSSLWSKRIFPNNSGAIISEGVVFVGGSGFYALQENTGDLKWKAAISGLFSKPAIIDSQGNIIQD
ncbi:MAG: hypothetical protein EOO88_34255 [Pedobacter sp.]|nr:MAG: hypothetical protein EOO88_34255 [Pedobacter sp.]